MPTPTPWSATCSRGCRPCCTAYCWRRASSSCRFTPRRRSNRPAPPTPPGASGVLGLTVGLPYFLLSSTGPLLQAWYAREHKGGMPYVSMRYRMPAPCSRCSAIRCCSNRASPLMSRLGRGRSPTPRLSCYAGSWLSARVSSNHLPRAVETLPPGSRERKHYIMWLLLRFTASLLLLAITNHISQNVAAIPFLWILPLSLYLLSFILCFESSGWYRRNPYLQLVAVALGVWPTASPSIPRTSCPSGAAGNLRSGTLRLLHGLPRRVGPI